ncbi:hypothetical protein AG1IA_07186 [Rhizoctonia solani AG-1 IA]|uniref:Uncharacterized protein n=1 Tax=Thanatephorus cucumeris (strain AG1-IA) TaxID=983506 RepID=L8WLJ9_THACA|nr:hypothetical protein AG1IA_07186 [Rhizoctonia solani AG-1 IA]
MCIDTRAGRKRIVPRQGEGMSRTRKPSSFLGRPQTGDGKDIRRGRFNLDAPACALAHLGLGRVTLAEHEVAWGDHGVIVLHANVGDNVLGRSSRRSGNFETQRGEVECISKHARSGCVDVKRDGVAGTLEVQCVHARKVEQRVGTPGVSGTRGCVQGFDTGHRQVREG